MIRQLFRCGLVCLFSISLVVPLSARQWNASPTALANDYVQIIDQRSQREVVLLMWMAPVLIPDTPENKIIREILDDYIVLGIAHADVSNVGQFSFRDLPVPRLRRSADAFVEAMEAASIPPGVAGGITGIQQVFAQNLGVLGKGIKWFVYDGTWLKTCGRGHFWITVSGTEYDYVTPVPGCPKIPSGIEPS